MELLSGGKSTLNPNAPVFIPAAFRQVEDFSPEWWELVKTSKWFHEYWLAHQQQQEEDIYSKNSDDQEDLANLLPETFDLGVTDEVSCLEAEHTRGHRGIHFAEEPAPFYSRKDGIQNGGSAIGAESLIKDLSLKSPRVGVRNAAMAAAVPAWYQEKAALCMSPRFSPRRIQQPR